MSVDPVTRHYRAIALWLYACCAMIALMVVLGGVTRLTGSGLSMVDWQPIYGVLPPLTESDWQALFDQYRQSPEYRAVNRDMDLAGFKGIFWLEYLHRLFGRLIGVVFLAGLVGFAARRRIPGWLMPRLGAVFVLGGLQGLLGWYMVKSGLVDIPRVSQYRLTAHLLLAVAIYAYSLWLALTLWPGRPPLHAPAGLRRMAVAVLGLAVLTIASGGFVAGLRAGLAFNTFPLMNGEWIPNNLFVFQPWYINFFENIATVQFDHRVLALTTVAATITFWAVAQGKRLAPRAGVMVHALLYLAVLQALLGIATLLLRVPLGLAAAHQAGALALLTAAVAAVHQLGAGRTALQPAPAAQNAS